MAAITARRAYCVGPPWPPDAFNGAFIDLPPSLVETKRHPARIAGIRGSMKTILACAALLVAATLLSFAAPATAIAAFAPIQTAAN
jgi:hypothetical protein